jgi:hypothetical protein
MSEALSPQSATALVERCTELRAAAGEAVDWVASVRERSPRLDREADGLILKLRQSRNLARRLGAAASRPVSIGFFGLSQAGKSYLISALAADADGNLDTLLDDERLSFIAHVNPPGGGKEATGLVTRFTRQASPATPGFPLCLSLFSETDLVKILGNSFFNDFDHEQRETRLDIEAIRARLDALQERRRPTADAPVEADDLVDLRDYFRRRFPKTTAHLETDYWPSAMALAPHLGLADRARLYAVLWDGIDAITETFLMLAEALALLGNPTRVRVPLSALVSRDDNGDWTQAGSIVNVDILAALATRAAGDIAVLAEDDDAPRSPVTLPRPTLAALTAELRFELAAPARSRLLEDVDLLDFPGYRGRLQLLDTSLQAGGDASVAQLILRGKVAYLFERYTDDQEMNALVLCTPSNKQIDVEDLGPVLDEWVRATQGAEPEVRGRRPAGLFWALTMFDHRLAPNPQQTEDLIRLGWDGMMQAVLLERFGRYAWLDRWDRDGAFRNLHPVRKPGMAPAVIETLNGREIRLQPTQQDWLDLLQRTFLEDAKVRRHLDRPAEAWAAMLALNDGGMQRLAERLRGASPLEHKLARIAEQIADTAEEIARHRLARYYQAAGEAEVANKEQLADRLAQDLNPITHRFDDLLSALQPDREELVALYLRGETAALPESGASASQVVDDPWAAPVEPQSKSPGLTDGAARFARATLSHWTAQLRRLPEDALLRAYFGIPRDGLEDLVDELLLGADRLRLEHALATRIESAEAQTGGKRRLLAERQAFVAALFLSAYIDYLGCADQPLGERPRGSEGRAIFAPQPPVPDGQRPSLPERMPPYPRRYKDDWISAFRALCIANAGHAINQELTPEDNRTLGSIIRRLTVTDGAGEVATGPNATPDSEAAAS